MEFVTADGTVPVCGLVGHKLEQNRSYRDFIMDTQMEAALRGGEFKKLLESLFSEIRQKYGLKIIDIEVLSFLAKCNENNTPTDIYRTLKVNRGHVSQAIDELCKRKLIIAIPDYEDRRYMHYKIGTDAQEIIADIEVVHKAMEEKLFQGVSSEELEVFKKVSYQISNNISKML